MEVPHAQRGMADHPGPNLDKPPDDRVYGRLDALAPERGIPNHLEQIVGKASYEEPGLIGRNPMATRLVPFCAWYSNSITFTSIPLAGGRPTGLFR